MEDKEEIVIQQGQTIKRRPRKVKVVPDDETISNNKKRDSILTPVPEDIKVQEYRDLSAHIKPVYKFARVIMKANQIENEYINKVLNSAIKILRWEEKPLNNEGDLDIYILYAEKPKTDEEEK